MAEQLNTEEELPKQTPLMRALSLLWAIWRRIENIVFGIVFFLITLYLLLQMPAVQNWLIRKITAYLSEELSTTVQVRHVNISFFDNLVLEGFYVQDLKGDTLLYAGELTAGLNSNIFSLFRNKLEFNEISLKKARFNIRRTAGEYDNNFQFLIDYFSGEKKKPPKKPQPFRIRIQNLHLSDVEFLKNDEVRGQRMRFRVPTGTVRVNNLDIPSKIVDIRSADFNGFTFIIEERPSQPLPERAIPVSQLISAEVDSLEAAERKRPFRFSIGRFSLTEGRFELDKYGQNTSIFLSRPDVIDYNHLKAQDIDIQADSVEFDDELVFHGILHNLSAREKSGFQLTHVEAGRVVVCDTLTALYSAKIETPGTSLGDTVAFHYNTYKDYRQFTDKVRMEIRLAKGSKLRIGDINFFSPGLADNTFFIQNSEEVAEISGAITGRVNKNLRGQNLDIKLDENTYMLGSFDGDNLTGSDTRPQKMTFKFEPLRSDFKTISRIIPGFTAPEQFYRLGQIGISGTYDILYGDVHILFGNVTTDIGSGQLDMALNLTDGRDKATYSGNLNMKNFDLAAWTGNRDFGRTSFNIRIEDPSSGLSLKTMNANLSGKIDTFLFRGYNYHNVSLNGQFREYLFRGELGVNDDNIKFNFKGDVNLKDSIPVFDFSADLRRLDLGALNLMNEDWILSGEVERIRLRARDIDDVMGSVLLRDFIILQDHEITHRIDSLSFVSSFRPDGTRVFKVRSDIADAELAGIFNLNKVPKNLLQIFARQHPEFSKRLGLPTADSTILADDYTMWLKIKNTQGLTYLISPELDTLRNIYANARVEASRGYTQLLLNAPQLKFGGIEVQDVGFAWHGDPDTSFYNLRIPQMTLSERYELAPIRLGGYVAEDELHFELEAKDSTSIVESINLDGILSSVDSVWQIKFKASEFALFKTRWYMDENNLIRFNDKFFEPQNFDLMSDNLRINLEGTNNGRGLKFSSANFNIDFLNKFVKDTTLHIRGRIAGVDLIIQELFLLQDIEANIDIDELFLKEKSYGGFYGFAKMADVEAPVEWRFVLQRGIEEPIFRTVGAWLPGGGETRTSPFFNLTVRPGEIQSTVRTTEFPLAVLETFVPGISKTAGKFNAEVALIGPVKNMGIDGAINVESGQFQIDYLKTMYHLRNQKIKLTEYQIWADGDTIWDATQQNMALIKGGLKHNHFRDWSLECSIKSHGKKFMILNTLPEDNALYYGQGIGEFEAIFSGSFNRTNITITATTGENTRLYIPISSTSGADANNFITFKNKNQDSTLQEKTKSLYFEELKGLNLEMNLTVTEAAEVQLIFDEKAGDIIKSRGEGDITLTINREGDFKMYGGYQIRRGEYLFTLLNLVNKPFTVLDGGTINWYGDPYGAQINLDATYEENTSLYNLIRDEIEFVPSAKIEATKATRVIVTMHLKGDLLKPGITFDIEFPNISSQLKTLVDNKLRLLRQDQNELNRQVFGLVVVGSFLPTNSGGFIQNSAYLTSAFNTLTQVLSNQLSNYLTGLATEWFGGAVSSIDFDVAYNEYENALSDPSQSINQIGRELQVRLTSGFANDRVTIQFGSQFGLGRPGTTTQDGFLGEDVTVEIQLTENRQWRLKIYQRTEPDIAGGERRARYGFGISFRKDYDSFDDMVMGLNSWFKNKS